MKKNNFEMKFYEFIGIKQFRKAAFFLYRTLIFPFTIGMTKEERKNFISSCPNNYIVGKTLDIDKFRKFKKMLLINTSIHIFGLVVCAPNFLKTIGIIDAYLSIPAMINNMILIIINCYCIMLQRYNWIRINNLIEKAKPREEKKKDSLKRELENIDQLLPSHCYKIVNRFQKETEISLDELLNESSLQQLKNYKENLMYFQCYSQFIENFSVTSDVNIKNSVSVPIEKNKELKFIMNNTNKNTNN